MKSVLVLHYAGCGTCKKAIAWMKSHGVSPDAAADRREEPPTAAELAKWIPASGLPVRRWLNTSGLSYRAIGKEKIDAMSDAEIAKRLAADGKLVRRPVLVDGRSRVGGLLMRRHTRSVFSD